MKNINNNNIRILFFLLLFSYIQFSYADEELIKPEGMVLSDLPLVEKTKNKDKASIASFFNKDLTKLIRLNEEKVLFMSNGNIGVNTEDLRWPGTGTLKWTNDFVITEKQEFLKAPDNHGSTKYQLIRIGETSIIIRYQSEFHHGSFGENKITIDEGTFEVTYRE